MLTVLRQRDFGLLWTAGLISFTGDWMFAIALPITVYELAGSALATGGVLISYKVAALMIGTFAGVLVDRWDRKRIMVIANIVRAGLLLPLLLVNSPGRVWIVYLVGGGISAAGQFFRPAESALLPNLVSEEHLVPANSLNALNGNLAQLMGTALGGVVAAWIGLGGVVAIDSVTYVIAAGLIAAIAFSKGHVHGSSKDLDDPVRAASKLRSEWLEGIGLIRVNPVLRIVFVVFAVASLGEGVLQTSFWIFVESSLHGGARESGWLLSAQAFGGIAGAMVVGALAKSRAPLTLLGWGALGMGVVDLAVFNYPAFIAGLWLGLLLMAVCGIPAAAFGTGYFSSVQSATEDSYRGRVFGALGAVSALFMIAGATFAGIATERFGPVAVLSIDCFGYAVGGAFALWVVATGVISRSSRDVLVRS